jgi:hypothetical protein
VIVLPELIAPPAVVVKEIVVATLTFAATRSFKPNEKVGFKTLSPICETKISVMRTVHMHWITWPVSKVAQVES